MKLNNLTIHGYERVKERSGQKGKSISESSKRAWLKGKSISEFSGRIGKYLTNVLISSGDSDREIRVFGGSVYIYNKIGILITMFGIPEKIKRSLGNKKNDKAIRSCEW